MLEREESVANNRRLLETLFGRELFHLFLVALNNFFFSSFKKGDEVAYGFGVGFFVGCSNTDTGAQTQVHIKTGTRLTGETGGPREDFADVVQGCP